MKDMFKTLCEYVFSGGFFLFLSCVAFIYCMVFMVNADNNKRANTRAEVAACYANGMVRVDTDAGPRCVVPSSLVVVK